ncbi:MAG: hypothetical protein WC558_07090, partial [Patulibacter sp.]
MKLIIPIIILILLILIPGITVAVPTNTVVTAISNNNVTFTATMGTEATAWFQYGMTATTLNVWTPSQSVSGAYTWTEIGSPLTSGETY